jgi:hypothetical protein
MNEGAASRRPIVTLLTDFGLDDAFVGMMKGVVLQRAPRSPLVDLTHAIPPQDVRLAGYTLADSWRFFPPGTIHVAVVDPGVGSDRPILAARIEGQIMLAPDNGLLTAVFEQASATELRQVSNRDVFLKTISQTFHGRDIFAPTAGALAGGMALADVGPPAETWVTLDLPGPRVDEEGRVHGEVVSIDHFGNLITNIPGPMLPLQPRVRIADRAIGRLSRSYAESEAGELLAIVSSAGRLEVAKNRGSAAAELGVGIGEPLTVGSALEERP